VKRKPEPWFSMIRTSFGTARTGKKVVGKCARTSDDEEPEPRNLPRLELFLGVKCIQERCNDQIVGPDHGGRFHLCRVRLCFTLHFLGRTNTRCPRPAIPKPMNSAPSMKSVKKLEAITVTSSENCRAIPAHPPFTFAPRYSLAAIVACNAGQTVMLPIMRINVFSLILNGPGFRSTTNPPRMSGNVQRFRGMIHASSLPRGYAKSLVADQR
jgi:hypothetical protein